VAIRQLLETASAIGQAHGNEDAVLDAFVNGVRAFVGEAGVRLVLPRAGPHPGQPLRLSIRGRAPTPELATLVAAWEEEIRAGSTPIAPDATGEPATPVDPSGAAPDLTIFPVRTPEGTGALVVGAAYATLTAAVRSALGVLCQHASTALALAGTIAVAEHTEALFETLSQLSGSYSEADLLLDRIVQRTAALLGMDAAWLMLCDDQKARLTLTKVCGITSPAFSDMSISVNDLLPGAAIRKRRVVCLRDAQGDEQSEYSRPEGLRTVMCAPMFMQDELIGVLVAAHREVRDASPEDRRIMSALASAAAVSIANARLNSEREERARGLTRALELQQTLTRLVLGGSSLDEVCAVIAEAVGCGVLILDPDRGILHRSSDSPSIPDGALAAAVDSTEQTTSTAIPRLSVSAGGTEVEFAIAPLDLAGERTAYVVIVGGESGLAAIDQGVIESAVTAIGLELMRERAVTEAEARLTGGLFHMLLSGDGVDASSITRRASYLGFDLLGENAVVAVAAPDEAANGASAFPSRIRSAIRRLGLPTPAVFEAEGASLVLLSGDELTPSQLRRHCSSIALQLSQWDGLGASQIAFAGPFAGIEGVRRAVREALHALRVLRITGKQHGPTGFDELGIWTLLGAVEDRERLLAFKDSVLGPLIEHDRKKNSQLVDTLRALVEANFHLRAASERLFVHPNTLRYRLPRIAELTGLDLERSEDRLRVDISLRILDMVEPR
jgi:sugar diacid utilization regulator/type II secretory pathway pseudopilin PulG